ncbi:site-specific integrase [Psychromonas sp. SA13A]|uniref:site-specific integrase n=1 Tax=Psychromonas sp. SA13A TaxID=2686346 RepID=UPI00140D3E5B|nr:site-specific integrase [Psychromonas sp. SA13A]
MRKVHRAKKADLSLIEITCPIIDSEYPFITNKDGSFDWLANEFMMEYSGGVNIYGIKPVCSTIVAKSRSLTRFLNYIESKAETPILLTKIEDTTIFNYVKYLQKYYPNDEATIKKHVRSALQYLIFVQEKHKELFLITSEEKSDKKYQVHIKFVKYSTPTYINEYIEHDSIKYLGTYDADVEMVSDDQLFHWLDAIHCTKEHPNPSEGIILRWEAITYLLDATGSRINELYDISRESIKSIYSPLKDADEYTKLENIPILKGKYKGKCRAVEIPNATIQILMSYINFIEEEFPEMKHDKLFVNIKNGKPLKRNYLKNYTANVVNKSKYSVLLKNISNHSFRHRFITLNVAEKLVQIAKLGIMTNMLSVAMNATRKLTMHASNDTLSTYVQLATEYNSKKYSIPLGINSPHRLVLTRVVNLVKSYQQGMIDSDLFAQDVSKIIDKTFS